MDSGRIPKRQTFAAIFGGTLIVATLLPLIPSNQWWIRIFDFPRAQIAALLVAALALLFLSGLPRRRRGRLLGLVLLLCFAYQLSRILPYMPVARAQVPTAQACAPQHRLRFMEANVLQDNRDAAALLALVRDQRPDLLLLTETDAWWARQLRPLREKFPHVVSVPLGNTYGMMLFSRLPLVDPEVRTLFDPEVPSIRAGVRLRSGTTVELYGIHPRPPVPGHDTAERDAEIVIVGREARQRARPTIVAGDLNDVAWSNTTRLFQEVSGLLDPRRGRTLLPTYPADLPLLRWPLDYVFVSPGFTLTGMQRLGDIGSDHLPILLVLCTADLDTVAPPSRRLPTDLREEVRETVAEGVEEAR